MLCRLGPITYPFKRHRVPHFLRNLTHFSRFSPTFTHIFPVLVPCTPILAVLMLRASLLNPSFCSFYLLGCLWHLSVLSSRGSGFGTQLPPKIGSLAETFLLAPSLKSFLPLCQTNKILYLDILPYFSLRKGIL